MIGLGALVVEHFAAIEADFQRFYGLDLAPLVWGAEPVTYRRLAALVRGIPVESALGVSIGAYRPGWGPTEELLAVLAEVIDYGNRLYYRVHSKRGAQQPKAIKITRPPDPNDAPKQRRKATSEDLREMFGGAVKFTGAPRDVAIGDSDRPLDVEAVVPDPPEDHP